MTSYGDLLKTVFAVGVFAFSTLAEAQTIGLPQQPMSITKVGNGDDGTDLEGAEPITSGPIWETRIEAVERLKSLNVRAIPGMSYVIPELETTKLLMAKQDAGSNGPQGLETTPDGKKVYARTFAEPHAATRFFPIALTLDKNQLVALHIHEALHRALPERIRENESTVAQLTLAMTSPDATFDRVNRLVAIYLGTPTEATEAAAVAVHAKVKPKLVDAIGKAPKRTQFQYEYRMQQFAGRGGVFIPAPDYNDTMHGFGLMASPWGVKKYGDLLIEPQVRGKLYYLLATAALSRAYDNYSLGPIDLEARLAVSSDENQEAVSYGPFVRASLKSLDGVLGKYDRDVYTLGAFYDSSGDASYFNAKVSVSLPTKGSNRNVYVSSGDGIALDIGQNDSFDTEFNTILTVGATTGWKWKRARLGIANELHLSNGYRSSASFRQSGGSFTESVSDRGRFTLWTVGPEIAFRAGRFGMDVYAKRLMNESKAENLTSLGDAIGRGSGQGEVGTHITFDL